MASTTKRAWKLNEFVAHAGDVNCLALGQKSGRVMVTGGEDKKVNMWAVGKPNCVLSLSGHTSPVEAVRFGNAEELVVAGSRSGALKIWDLEQAKIIRTLTGHKANIRSLDFHPYGEFMASGSKDTNIKLWDIRRKGCIFTYKGHSNTVNSLRFSPDGRWIASAADDGRLKLWDLAVGKLLHDFNQHSGPVTAVEFHPHEILLASGSADRTVKYWDMETFGEVGSTDGDSTGVRCIFFHPEESALYSGGEDSLRVYGWDPVRCFDSLAMGWGRVADMAIAQNQLIGASFSQTNVSTYVVDIQRIQPLGGPPMPASTAASRPESSQANSGTYQRRSFSERPATQSTKQQPRPKEEPEEPAPAAGAGDAAAAGATEEKDDDNIDIKDPKDFQEVFQTRARIARSPTRAVDPFPAPPDDASSAPAPAPSHHRSPSPKARPSSASNNPRPSSANSRKPPTDPAKNNGPQRKQSPPKATSPQQRKKSPSPPSKKKASPPPSSQPAKRESVKRESPQRKAEPKPTAPAKDKGGLNPDDFLPRSVVPSLVSAGERGMAAASMSETEAMNSIIKGHDSMMAVMMSRSKNLQIVRALWTGGNTKTALDSAIGMNDCAIMVDLLNVLITRPALWNLDMCSTLVPQISTLITSKYENYVTTAMSALRLVLKNFASVIKSNITAPPSVGVDMAREERYQKCKACYKYLMDIRSEVSSKHFSPNQAPLARELNLLMSQLD